MSHVKAQTADYQLADLSTVLKAAGIGNILLESLPVWLSAQTRKSAGRGRSADNTNQYGVQKLRELIIGLALRGQLTESYEMLHEKIEDEIANAKDSYFLCQSRAAKQWEHSEALIEEFEIPKGWLWKRIGMLCDLQTGATPSRNRPELFGGKIKWLVSGDINKVRIRECEGRITEEGLNSSNCKILPEGTVLIALNGQGKTRASTALLETKAACNQSLVGMIPFSPNLLESRFLLLALQYRYYEIRDITGQHQRRGLNMKLVSDLSIPLAPIQTQRQIVKKVDELMAVCDQLEQQQADAVQAHDTLVKVLLDTLTQAENADDFQQNWQRLAAHFDTLFATESSIDQLKQTLLQLAVMGKLVPQDPNDEPASSLLEKIAEEKARLAKEGKIKKQKPLPKVTDEEKPFELPDKWIFCRLQEIVTILGDGLHGTPRYDSSGEHYFVNGNNLNDGVITIKPETKKVSAEEYEKHKKDLNDRTVLVSINGTLGKIAFYNNEPVMLGKSACYFNLSPDISKMFIKRLVESPQFMKYAVSNATGSTIKNLGLKAMNSFSIALPPLAEQHRIVKKVDELMAFCDKLKARLNQAQILQQKLADTVVETTI
jgi:type I restriction enzyme S subunit